MMTDVPSKHGKLTKVVLFQRLSLLLLLPKPQLSDQIFVYKLLRYLFSNLVCMFFSCFGKSNLGTPLLCYNYGVN